MPCAPVPDGALHPALTRAGVRPQGEGMPGGRTLPTRDIAVQPLQPGNPRLRPGSVGGAPRRASWGINSQAPRASSPPGRQCRLPWPTGASPPAALQGEPLHPEALRLRGAQA